MFKNNFVKCGLPPEIYLLYNIYIILDVCEMF